MGSKEARRERFYNTRKKIIERFRRRTMIKNRWYFGSGGYTYGQNILDSEVRSPGYYRKWTGECGCWSCRNGWDRNEIKRKLYQMREGKHLTREYMLCYNNDNIDVTYK